MNRLTKYLHIENKEKRTVV